MSDRKPPKQSRTDKVYTALSGEDEFSVFSVSPEAQKPLVELETNKPEGQAEDTPLSYSSFVRMLRKIFRE
jgi:hypothetical protein